MNKLSLAFISLIFFSPTALTAIEHAPEPKVWGDREGNHYQIGPYKVDVYYKRTGGYDRIFYASFSSERRGGVGPGSYKPFHANFEGNCADVMSFAVDYTPGGDMDVDLSRYKETGRGRDLPVTKMFDAMREVLVDQCPGVQALRVGVQGWGHSALRDNAYKGTLQRDNGWKLEDGFVPLLAAETVEQEIKFVYFNAVRVSYKGTCTDKVDVSLVYVGNALHSEVRKQADRLGALKAFVKKYREACPRLKSVAVQPSSLGKDYRCKSSAECHYVFAEENDWQMGSSTVVYEEPEPSNFSTIIETLGSDKYFVQNNDEMFKLFFVSYMEHYGDACRTHLDNAIKIRYDYEEVSTDGQGYELSREHLNNRELYLDKEVAPLYDKYMRQRNGILAKWTISGAARARANSQSGASAAFDVAGFYLDNEKHIERFLANGCDNERVQFVYKVAVDLAAGR